MGLWKESRFCFQLLPNAVQLSRVETVSWDCVGGGGGGGGCQGETKVRLRLYFVCRHGSGLDQGIIVIFQFVFFKVPDNNYLN